MWCHTPLIPEFSRQRQADCYEFEASLVYVVSFRTARAVWRDSVSKQSKNKTSVGKDAEKIELFNLSYACLADLVLAR